MKKLILVTLTAFAASWLLAGVKHRQPPPVPDSLPQPVAIDNVTPHPRYNGQNVSITFVSDERKPSKKEKAARQPKGKPAQAKKVVEPTTPPDWFPTSDLEVTDQAPADPITGSRVIIGRLSASEDRARTDVRQIIERDVTTWLAADVPTSWKVPASVLDRMVQASYTQKVARKLIGSDKPKGAEGAEETEGTETTSAEPSPADLDGIYTLYRTGQRVDFSPQCKARIVRMYRQEVANQRLWKLGGGLVLALSTLAVVSSYIKADEATKGYYTRRLRVLAALGLGAGGAIAYRLLG